MSAQQIDVHGLPAIDYAALYEFATANRVNYNALCRVVRAALRQSGKAVGCHVHTGIYDKNGRELCVGDRVRVLLQGPSTKPEYWNPEYVVIWKAPSFGLKWVGGGLHSSTATWYFGLGTKQGSDKLETVTVAPAAAPPATSGLVEALRNLASAVFGDNLGDEPDVYADYDRLNKLCRETNAALAAHNAGGGQ